MNLIGLSGKMMSGKNTVASIIQYLCTRPDMSYSTFLLLNLKEQSRVWKQKAFADKLRQVVSILTGIPPTHLEKQEVKQQFLSPDWDRYALKEFWINDSYLAYNTINYFSTNKEMQDYINDMKHSNETCIQIGKQRMTVRTLLQEVGTDALRDRIHPDIWINALFSRYNEEKSKWVITDVRFPNEKKVIESKGGIVIRINRDDIPTSNHLSEISLDNSEFKYVINNNGTIQDLILQVKDILKKEKIIT
jgi:hypothetical protein